MAYLIVADRNGELDRRELLAGESLVVGRSLDCDICIRDILLSRKHCRIEPMDADPQRWVVTDLESKNGTRIGHETVTRHALSDGEVIRIGKSQICFHSGAFVPSGSKKPQRRDARPADPFEAMQGTVCGFQLFDMEEDSKQSGGFPIPQPRPPEPESYRNDDSVHSMVLELTSTSWDTVLSEPEFCPPTTLKVMTAATKSKKLPREIVARKQAILKSQKQPQSETTPATSEKVHVLPVIRHRSPAQRMPGWVAQAYIAAAAAVWLACMSVLLVRAIL